MKQQKTVTLEELQIIAVQKEADESTEGDFSRMLRVIINEWMKK